MKETWKYTEILPEPNWRKIAEAWHDAETGQMRNARSLKFSVRDQYGKAPDPTKPYTYTTSLFCENHDFNQEPIDPDVIPMLNFQYPDSIHEMLCEAGWAKRDRRWFEVYVKPLIEFENPMFDLHVYMDPQFAGTRLFSMLQERATIFVMEQPTKRHGPGSMWRFLGLGSGKPAQVIDSDALPYSDVFLEEMLERGCKWWRLAHCGVGEQNDWGKKTVFYHPMTASQFGCAAGAVNSAAVSMAMTLFDWAVETNQLQNSLYYPPTNETVPLFGVHPFGYGIDEIFLTHRIFHQALREGCLSLFPGAGDQSFISTLDQAMCESVTAETGKGFNRVR